MSVAIARLFGTAMSGRSDDRPDRVDAALSLTAHLPVVACRDGEPLLRRLFEPLGYRVEASPIPLDPSVPSWGDSRYLAVSLAAEVRVRDLLSHLYVLLPVLDDDKHYWVARDEIEKLLARGGEWLAAHPDKELITRRYLRYRDRFTREALSRLLDEDQADPDADEAAHDAEEEAVEERVSLRDQRLGSVLSVLRAADAHRVLDLGCGPGTLLRALMKEPGVTEVVGVDVSSRALDVAARRLHVDTMAPNQRTVCGCSRVAHLSGSAVEWVRRRRPDGGRRTSRTRTPRGARTVGVRLGCPDHGDRHDSQHRIQRPVRVAALRSTPSPRPPVRVDARRVPVMGRRGRGAEPIPGSLPAGGRGRSPGRSADATGGVRPMSRGPARPDPRDPKAGAERDRNEMRLPTLSLVVLVGLSGSGKSTFAARHFAPTEILSSDFCRGLVSDDDNDQTVTSEAFDVLHHIAGVRLSLGRITVVDATNVQAHARKPLVELARRHHVLPVAIVLDVPERLCQERNAGRAVSYLRAARDPPATRGAPQVDQPAPAGGVPPGLRAEGCRGDRRRLHHERAHLDRSLRRTWPLRSDRRYPRMPRRVGRTARPARVSPLSDVRRLRPSRGSHRGVPGRPGGPRSATPAVLATRDGHGRSRFRSSACPATTRSSSSRRSEDATCRSPMASVSRSPNSRRNHRSSVNGSSRSSTGW